MQQLNIYAFADEASGRMEGQIAAMTRNGLQGLEIRGVDGQNIADITTEKAREVRKKLDDAGLCVWSMGSPIGKIDIARGDFGAHLDKLRHTLDLADILGAKNLRMFSFYVPVGETEKWRGTRQMPRARAWQRRHPLPRKRKRYLRRQCRSVP